MVPNGLLPDAAARVTRRLDAERWAVAEERTAELIARIQPSKPSEDRRRAVADYVQRLIMGCLSCQVFTYGSVPLKTYLPDGDIDVTALSNSEHLKNTWAITVRDALEHEEKSEHAEFCVTEVQYIQAEVKIIKCLVEDIVVDISFNQVGGLCTLCFLEEMDNVIMKNHLFKRSIILIKAWCYYESRILGAHHGLISTYALETLVLYIFHVFNNSFAGPLEVLYRFLEFFSNFDWEKFCVSLWGPVRISALPDMTAEPALKDDGVLLLSKSFLDTRTALYAVTHGVQESLVQPFVSKHFNVIDPLRANNNLGRSVSKGNFFRIRSAFAFGAKRLARLLECPRDDLAVEVKQFFTNTWRRHGSGNRPDAPALGFNDQPMKIFPVEMRNSHRRPKMHKKDTENPASCTDNHSLTEDGKSYHDPTTQLLKKASLQSQNLPRTGHSAFHPMQSQKIYRMQLNTMVKNSIPGGSLPDERDERLPKTQFSTNDKNGQSRLQFARTNSSPELTDCSVEGFPRGGRTRVVEVDKSAKVDYNSKINNWNLGLSSNHINKSSQDEQVLYMNASYNASVATSDVSSVSSSHREDIAFVMNEELASVTEASDILHKRSQEEHDLADPMASTTFPGLNGQIPFSVQIPHHLSGPPCPQMASAVYSQENLAGVLPPIFPIIRAPWLHHNMQFAHGFVPPPVAHYVASPSAPNIEDGNECERLVTTDTNYDGRTNWQESVSGLSGNFNQEILDPSINNVLVPLNSEDNELRESYADILYDQSSGGVSPSSSTLSGSRGFVSSQVGSRCKTSADTSNDESTGKVLPSSRDKRGKKPAGMAPSSSFHSKTKTSWQFENRAECIPSDLDGTRNCDAVPIVNSDISDGIAGLSISAHSRTNEAQDDHDPLQVSRSSHVLAPFVIGSSQQGQVDNSKLTFVQTGPPVPFVVYPCIGNMDHSAPQFDRNESMCQFPVNMAFQNFGSHDAGTEPDANIMSTASSNVTADHDRKSDILNSDIIRHWENLQYGRFCQNARPPAYPIAIPPMYLQGHLSSDGSGRSSAHNINWSQLSPRQPVVPVMPLNPGSERGSGVFQRYGEDAPRYRGGTGTYLPNHKVQFRDRQPTSRNCRGSYDSDRLEYSDKEGNWVNLKQRNAGRSYGRSQSEKSATRSDRHTSNECRHTSDDSRHWRSHRNDSYRREAGVPSLLQSHSFGLTSPENMTYAFYSQPSSASNGASAASCSAMQPVVMTDSHGQYVSYGVSNDPIEFGSLGAISMDSSDIQLPTHEVQANGYYEQRHVQFSGGSSRSSPDQPS